MGNSGAHIADRRAILVCDEIGMRKDGMACQQAEIIERLCIGLAKAFKHKVVLPIAFRTVGLDVATRMSSQFAKPLQDLVGATAFRSWIELETAERLEGHPTILG